MCRVYFEQCRPYSPRIGECSLLIDDNNLGSEYEHIAEIFHLRSKPWCRAGIQTSLPPVARVLPARLLMEGVEAHSRIDFVQEARGTVLQDGCLELTFK